MERKHLTLVLGGLNRIRESPGIYSVSNSLSEIVKVSPTLWYKWHVHKAQSSVQKWKHTFTFTFSSRATIRILVGVWFLSCVWMARYCGHWSDGNTHNSDHPSSHFLPLLVIWTVALLSTHHCWWEDQWRRVQLNMKVIVARSGGARLVTGNFTELHLSMTDRTLPQHLLRGLLVFSTSAKTTLPSKHSWEESFEC